MAPLQLTVAMLRDFSLLRALALLPLVPIAAGLVLVLLNPVGWSAIVGDVAVLELHLRGVARLQHWLGPYSRFGWNHPGPLYYALLLPLYGLTGGSSVSLHLSAGLIGLGATAAATAAFFRERKGALQRVAFVAALCGFALDLFARRLPTNPWNPVVTVLPFALYWITCLQVASGRFTSLPLAVLLHAFLGQTHVSYLPCTSTLFGVALVLAVCQRRAQAPDVKRARWVVMSAVVLLVAWLPALIAEVRPGKSNVIALLNHFTGAGSRANPMGFVATYGATHLHPLLSRIDGISEHTRTTIALELVAAQTTLLLVGWIAARSRKDRFAGHACTLSVLGTVACFWSCRHIGVVAEQHEYLTHWFAVVGMFNWLAIVLALTPPLARFVPSLRVSRILFSVAATGLVVATASATADMWTRYRGTPASAARRLTRMQTLAAQTDRLESLLRADGNYMLSLGNDRPWGDLAGVVLGLEKRGLTPLVDQRWRFMFGEGRAYAPRGGDTPALLLSHERMHSASLIESFAPASHLYLHAPPLARHPSWTVRPASSSGSTGNVQFVCDGHVPSEGSPLSARRSLGLNGRDAFLTLHLPDLADRAVRVGGLRVAADADDAYVLSGSYDGARFVSIGVLPAASGRGLRSRDFHFNDGRAWSMVRISPARADHPHSIAEVSPIIEQGTRIDFERGEIEPRIDGSQRVAAMASAEAHPTVWFPMKAGAPARIALRIGSSGSENSASLAVLINGDVVGTFSFLGATLLRSVVLPGTSVQAVNRLHVEFVAPAADRHAKLRSIEVTNIGG